MKSSYLYNKETNSVDKSGADRGLVASGSLDFAAGDTLTTEKLTDEIFLPDDSKSIGPDAMFLLAIEKPAEDTAGNLTVNTYNQIKINGTDQRNVLHSTHTVEKVSSAATYRDFLIQGLFFGEGTIKLGMLFAADSGAITVNYKLYRL